MTAVAVIAAFWSLFFVSVSAQGLQPTWSSLRVHSYPSPFGDMFAITQSWDLVRAGGNPFRDPVPPWDGPLTYPRSWGWLTFLGIGSSSLQIFSIALALGFYSTVCFVLARGTAWRGLLVALASLSPGVLLCIERMNADIIIFLMLAAAVLLVCLQRPLPMAVGFGLASLAGMLKLFPAPAIPGFVPELRKLSVLLCLGALGAFAAFIVVDPNDLLRVDTVALRMADLSYGAGVTASAFIEMAAAAGLMLNSEPLVMIFRVTIVLCGLAGLWCGLKALFGSRVLDALLQESCSVFFRVGAMVYVATYLLVQSFNYRLIFLLFVLPLLLGTLPTAPKLQSLFRITGALAVACMFLAGTWNLRGWHGVLYGTVAFILACLVSLCLGVVFGRLIARAREQKTT
jgi:hypothetical protein